MARAWRDEELKVYMENTRNAPLGLVKYLKSSQHIGVVFIN